VLSGVRRGRARRRGEVERGRQSFEKSTGTTCGGRGVRLVVVLVVAAAVTSEVVPGVEGGRGRGRRET
jgi:hypothetical protein